MAGAYGRMNTGLRIPISSNISMYSSLGLTKLALSYSNAARDLEFLIQITWHRLFTPYVKRWPCNGKNSLRVS